MEGQGERLKEVGSLLVQSGGRNTHVRKIVALADLHGDAPVLRAMADALDFETFSSEHIAHLIEARERQLPEARPLVLMRRQDVLELELPVTDLSAYAAFAAGMTSGGDHGHD